MIFKEDWDICQKRFDAFWDGEMLDRCLISVIAPRKKPLPTDMKPVRLETLEDRWTNAEKIHNNLMYGCHGAFFGGEAFPNFFPNLGPGVIAAFMGSPYILAEDTVWFDRTPIISDWDTKPEIKLDRTNKMWETACHMVDYYSSRCNGNYRVAFTDIGGSLDILAALRSTENLLLDLYDHPDEVKKMTVITDRIWFECYDGFHKLMSPYVEGTSTWLPLWCRKRYYTLQCDFSAMISPSQFEEFVLPTLEQQTEFLDYSIYHLDGPGQLRHLDLLLDMKRLTGIQWVAGAGIPDEMDEMWYPIYQKIQQKGKNLVISCNDPGKIEKLLKNISPIGLCIITRCVSEDDAVELLKMAEKWIR